MSVHGKNKSKCKRGGDGKGVELTGHRAAVKRVMEDTEGRDVEYGRFCGKMRDVNTIIDREYHEGVALQISERFCPAQGVIRCAINIPGNIPLIHGTAGCTALHKTDWAKIGNVHGMPLWPVPTTAMGPEDVFLGAEDKLKKAIVEVDQYYKPDMISVIKTCAAAITGENVAEICHTLKNQVNCKLLPVEAGGYSSRNQGAGQGLYLQLLAEHIMEPQSEIIPNSINYIGDSLGLIPGPYDFGSREIRRVLDLLGVKIHCYIPGSSSVSEIVTAPKASLNVQRCMSNAMGLSRVMEERFGTPYISSTVPVGITATTEFFVGIIDGLDLGAEAEEVIKSEVAETNEMLEPYKEKLAGKTFALTLGSGRTTPTVELFLELDMVPVYIGFHFIREKTFPNIKHLEEKLASRGYDPIVLVEPNFYEEEKIIAELQPDIFFCDYFRHLNFRHGVTPVQIMGLPWLGYRGAVHYAEMTIKALNNPVFRRFGQKMFPNTFASEDYLFHQKGEWS